MQIWRSILAILLLLIRCWRCNCFAFQRSGQLYGGTIARRSLHQAPFEPAQKLLAVHSPTVRYLQRPGSWSVSWLADKTRELIQPSRLLQSIVKRIRFQREAPATPVHTHPPMQQFRATEVLQHEPMVLTRKSLHDELAGVDLEVVAFPPTTEYPPLLQAVLDFHPAYMLPTQLRVAKIDQMEDRLVTSLLKCFMVTDMRKYSVPFDAPYYNDWVFSVPPEGYAQSGSDEQWPDEQAAGRRQVFARPSFPEAVAAIGEPTPQEAALLDKKGSSQSEKTRHWKQYVDRALRQKAESFKDQLQNTDIFNQSAYDELQYYQLHRGIFESLDHWASFQHVALHRILGSRVYDLNSMPGVMFTLATRYSLPLEVVVTLKQAKLLFDATHVEWSVDQCVAFLHSFRTCLSKQYMTTMLTLAKDRLLRAIPQMNTQDVLMSLLGVSRAVISDDPAVSAVLRELLARIPDEHLKWTLSDITLALKVLTSEPRLQKHMASVGERLLSSSPDQLLSESFSVIPSPKRNGLSANQTAVLDILAQMHNSSEVNVLLGQVEQSLNRSEAVLEDLVKRHATTVTKRSTSRSPSAAAAASPASSTTKQKQLTSAQQLVSRLLELITHLHRAPHSLGTDEFLFDVARKISKVTADAPYEGDINELVGVAFGFRNRSNAPELAMDRAAIRTVALLRRLNALPVSEDAIRAAVFQFEGLSALVTILTEATLRAKGDLLPSVLRRALEHSGRMDVAVDNHLRALLISWAMRLLTSRVALTDEEAIALTNQLAQRIVKDMASEHINENALADFRFWINTLKQKVSRSNVRPDISSHCFGLLEETEKAIERAVSELPKNIYSA